MMREIRFRGKREDNKEWVYGYYFEGFTGISYILVMHDHILRMTKFYKVDPATLGQYTGLKDKNGVEIYEGDLVAVADYANWEGLYKIIWDENNLMYMLEDAFGDREKLCEYEEYLIKGNIYENPELLEG